MTSQASRASHNLIQRRYFEGSPKEGMLPAKTPYVRRQVAQLLAHLSLPPGSRVLEAGCGMGRYTFELLRTGMEVEGLDIAPGLLSKLDGFAGQRGARIALHCADLAEPPSRLEGRYDAVLGFFTLHHVHDLDACLAGAARLVVPGGKVGFLEPNPYCPSYYLQILATRDMTWQGERGILNMRAPRVRAGLTRAGLVPLQPVSFGFFPPALANSSLGGAWERRLEAVPALAPVRAFQVFAGVKARSGR